MLRKNYSSKLKTHFIKSLAKFGFIPDYAVLIYASRIAKIFRLKYVGESV